MAYGLVRDTSKAGDDKAGTQTLIDRGTAEARHRVDVGDRTLPFGDHLRRVKRLLWSTVLTVSLFLQTATSSQAFTIDTIGISGGNPGRLPVYEVTGLVQGDSFNVIWNLPVQGQTLRAEAAVTIVSLSPAVAQVSLTLANTSTVGRMTIFGLSVDHFVILGIGVPGLDLDTFDDVQSNIRTGFPGMANFVDACATSGNNCAGGGGGGGIIVEDGDAFTFSLNGNFASTLTLGGFALKFKMVPPVLLLNCQELRRAWPM